MMEWDPFTKKPDSSALRCRACKTFQEDHMIRKLPMTVDHLMARGERDMAQRAQARLNLFLERRAQEIWAPVRPLPPQAARAPAPPPAAAQAPPGLQPPDLQPPRRPTEQQCSDFQDMLDQMKEETDAEMRKVKQHLAKIVVRAKEDRPVTLSSWSSLDDYVKDKKDEPSSSSAGKKQDAAEHHHMAEADSDAGADSDWSASYAMVNSDVKYQFPNTR